MKYSYVTEVQAGDETGFGYGKSESQLLSFQKSIVEGAERAVYKATKARNPEILTSNGWAAHVIGFAFLSQTMGTFLWS